MVKDGTELQEQDRKHASNKHKNHKHKSGNAKLTFIQTLNSHTELSHTRTLQLAHYRTHNGLSSDPSSSDAALARSCSISC